MAARPDTVNMWSTRLWYLSATEPRPHEPVSTCIVMAAGKGPCSLMCFGFIAYLCNKDRDIGWGGCGVSYTGIHMYAFHKGMKISI